MEKLFMHKLPRVLCMNVGIVQPAVEITDDNSAEKSDTGTISKWKCVAVVCERFFAVLYFTALLITLFGTICTLP